MSGVTASYQRYRNSKIICINSYNENQLDALIPQIYFWNETLHVSDSSSVHHQEIFTVHTEVVYVIQVCCVYSEKLQMMDRGIVRNM